ncbi:flagellar basal body-associated protein FliL [Halobacillus yeomjeoni]|uniref:Flagellar protein FliL n=1 Tax=Halobacillus yeomjeoni TaxID=311194 RepID=A0A931HT61_9BACI|nr:flagellar basal body-associated protein FliL [Halobacillus yeomjeoni]MBH0229280.1 flagellar basal body-associated protein FliL [Halobacillus yeomjeoni]MCA0983321.1 flagellar basal body-associated protein FliL [Halobacillus yeomjeoni]
MFKTMIIILSALTVMGVVALILVLNFKGSDEASTERSIDDIVEASYETEEITTDLKSGDYVRIKFRIVTDEKKAVEELQKRDFQVKNILIKEMAKMETQTFQTGLSTLEETLKLKLNEFMTEGKVTDVYTIDKVLQ